MRFGHWLVAAVALVALAGVASAQLGDSSFDQIDHPAIQYSTRPARDPVAALDRRIQAGDLRLSFDAAQGYLRSVLGALEIPIESQVVVFSKTSTQMNLIHPRNPRAVYFNDSVSVGWTRGTFVLEVAAQDPEQGTIFYEMDQRATGKPPLRRTRACLRCHHSLYTNGVPGRLMRSTPTAADGIPMPWTRNLATDYRTPFDQRWGGWYVTGRAPGLSHRGNVFATSPAQAATERAPDVETLEGRFDTAAYLTPYSDVVALMVLEHQTRLTNLLTRLGWETRAAAYEAQAGGSTPRPSGRAAFSVEAAVANSLSSQARGFVRGGGGMSTSRVASPTVVASWVSHENYADGSATTLLVLWRGTPGWFSKGGRGGSGGGGGSGTGGGGSYAWAYVSEGGLTFTMGFDYEKGTANILNQEFSLKETNVVLVDFVDSENGPTIVGYRWIDPAPPEQPSTGDPIGAIVKRTPELFEYLRCDLALSDPVMNAMMPIICGQMRP